MHLLYPTYVSYFLNVAYYVCSACVESSAQIQAAGTYNNSSLLKPLGSVSWVPLLASEEKNSFSVRREVSDRTGIFSIIYQEGC